MAQQQQHTAGESSPVPTRQTVSSDIALTLAWLYRHAEDGAQWAIDELAAMRERGELPADAE